MKGAAKLAVGAGSVALALLAAEGALRVVDYDPLTEALNGRVQLVRPSQAPGRGYELVPDASGKGWGTQIEINSHGFRGPEVALEANGRTRIVALGDSVTFGNDLAYAETWPASLERELRGAGHPVDVLDLGLGGYDTTQEVATLEAIGLDFHPAHVILGYCVNDVGVVSMSLETPFVPADRANPFFRSRIAQWLHVQAAERSQRRALSERNREERYALAFAAEIRPLDAWPEVARRVAELRTALASAPDAEEDLASRRIPARWYASDERIGRLASAFMRLGELARARAFGVTVLIVPYLAEDEPITRGLEIVRALAEAQGFGVVSPVAEFHAAGLATLRIRAEDPVHPNANGHARIADALAGYLPVILSPCAQPEPGE